MIVRPYNRVCWACYLDLGGILEMRVKKLVNLQFQVVRRQPRPLCVSHFE